MIGEKSFVNLVFLCSGPTSTVTKPLPAIVLAIVSMLSLVTNIWDSSYLTGGAGFDSVASAIFGMGLLSWSLWNSVYIEAIRDIP
jgi:methyl coenzyme M reductase alpha subunit